MQKLVVGLVVAIAALAALVSAGPVLVALAHAAVPLVIAVGCIAIAWRIVWHFTRRY